MNFWIVLLISVVVVGATEWLLLIGKNKRR